MGMEEYIRHLKYGGKYRKKAGYVYYISVWR